MANTSIGIIIFLVISTKSSLSTTDEDTLVTIEQGSLRGFREKSTNGKDFYSFLGIPYAQPPIGKLRFKDPVPGEPWEGILEANQESELCIQIPKLKLNVDNADPEGSEDCLYLKIHTPKLNNDANLPVLFYVHGGGMVFGGLQDYNPHTLLNEDIVLVFVAYRLNVFGLLDTKNPAISGNLALKDIIEALKFVQRNIKQFGGNPDMVTIAGHSSGSILCQTLLLSPRAKGLFQGAILLSGSILADIFIDFNDMEKTEEFLQALGCNSNDEPETFIQCMQSIDTETVFNTNLMYGNTMNFFSSGSEEKQKEKKRPNACFMSLITDGDYIPEHPSEILKSKKQNSVNIIASYTREDAGVYVPGDKIKEKDIAFGLQSLSFVGPSLGITEETIETFKDYYHFSNGDLLTSTMQAATDCLYKLPVDILVYAERADSQNKIYTAQLVHKGQYSLGDSLEDYPGKDKWIVHSDELYFLFTNTSLFHTPNPITREEDRQISQLYTKLIGNFVKTGNPTPDDSLGFTWEPSTPANMRHLDIKVNPEMQTDKNELIELYSKLPMKWLQKFLDGNEDPSLAKIAKRVSKDEL